MRPSIQILIEGKEVDDIVTINEAARIGEFDRNDFMAYAGAENWPDGSPPLIAEDTWDGCPVTIIADPSGTEVILGEVGELGSLVSPRANSIPANARKVMEDVMRTRHLASLIRKRFQLT